MKMKFIYFLISCMFAVITTVSINAENVSSAFKEKETNIVLMVNKVNIKNYTALNINRIEPQKRIVEDKEQFYSFDAVPDIEVISKIVGLFPVITEKVNLIFNYSILLRYESRVLRL